MGFHQHREAPQHGLPSTRVLGASPTWAASHRCSVQYHRCSAVPQVQCSPTGAVCSTGALWQSYAVAAVAAYHSCGSPMRWQLWQSYAVAAVAAYQSCGSPMRWQLWQCYALAAVTAYRSCGSPAPPTAAWVQRAAALRCGSCRCAATEGPHVGGRCMAEDADNYMHAQIGDEAAPRRGSLRALPGSCCARSRAAPSARSSAASHGRAPRATVPPQHPPPARAAPASALRMPHPARCASPRSACMPRRSHAPRAAVRVVWRWLACVRLAAPLCIRTCGAPARITGLVLPHPTPRNCSSYPCHVGS
jgi:hypothetical protein